MTRFTCALFPLLLLAGCGPDATDEGAFCIGTSSSSDPPITLEASKPIVVTVVYDSCLSGCANDLEGTCTVERDGNKLVVHSEFSYDDGKIPGASCPSVCVPLSAQCSSGPLEAGSYTIVHGVRTMSLSLQSTLTTTCTN
jgi:hypothetical protein